MSLLDDLDLDPLRGYVPTPRSRLHPSYFSLDGKAAAAVSSSSPRSATTSSPSPQSQQHQQQHVHHHHHSAPRSDFSWSRSPASTAAHRQSEARGGEQEELSVVRAATKQQLFFSSPTPQRRSGCGWSTSPTQQDQQSPIEEIDRDADEDGEDEDEPLDQTAIPDEDNDDEQPCASDGLLLLSEMQDACRRLLHELSSASVVFTALNVEDDDPRDTTNNTVASNDAQSIRNFIASLKFTASVGHESATGSALHALETLLLSAPSKCSSIIEELQQSFNNYGNDLDTSAVVDDQLALLRLEKENATQLDAKYRTAAKVASVKAEQARNIAHKCETARRGTVNELRQLAAAIAAASHAVAQFTTLQSEAEAAANEAACALGASRAALTQHHQAAEVAAFRHRLVECLEKLLQQQPKQQQQQPLQLQRSATRAEIITALRRPALQSALWNRALDNIGVESAGDVLLLRSHREEWSQVLLDQPLLKAMLSDLVIV